MMSHVPDLRQFLYVVKDEQLKYDTAVSVLKAFEETVIPAYPKLKQGSFKKNFKTLPYVLITLIYSLITYRHHPW
jgi:hypothetical protein